MTAYLTAVVWGAFVLASMVGWGDTIRRILRSRSHMSWAQHAALGFAFSAGLGGLLDLVAVISRSLIVGFLAVGAAVSLYRLAGRALAEALATPEHSPAPRFLATATMTLVATLLAIRLAGSVIVLQPIEEWGAQPERFNVFDDFQAHMVYPLRMIETGSMRSDPFSLRRTPTHSFGGNAFLQTFVLAALPVQSLRLLDVGLGTTVIVGLLWRYLSHLGAGRFRAGFVILAFLAIPPPTVNVTALLIPAALFLSLFLIFLHPPEDAARWSHSVLIGVHVGALCVLKTSLIPAALGFAGVQACFTVVRAASKPRAAAHALSWFVCAGVAVLPWLLDARRWTGTFVPSSLGAYHAHPSRVSGLEEVRRRFGVLERLADLQPVPYLVLAGLVGALLLMKAGKGTVPDPFWSLLAAVALGSLSVAIAVGGAVSNIDRLIYPYLVSALMIALAQVTAPADRNHAYGARIIALSTALAALAPWILQALPRARDLYKSSLTTAMRAVGGETLIDPALAARYRSLQSRVPPSATLLARMDQPFLFDFRRNQIFIVDSPGSASLAPGMPAFQGSESLAAYLVSHGIRYVAYDYVPEAQTARKEPLARPVDDNGHSSAQAVAGLTLDFQDNLRELDRTRQRLYDDDKAFVLDLSTPR